MVVGDKDYMKMMLRIMKHTEMTLPEANAFLHDSVGVTKKGRHRFFGNAQHRKGAKGFDQDVQWALTHYLNASARYVAMEHFKPEASMSASSATSTRNRRAIRHATSRTSSTI